jgi:predicted house-cleaning NTP pyrophosphatase (Maf/HAM1 superfamily)
MYLATYVHFWWVWKLEGTKHDIRTGLTLIVPGEIKVDLSDFDVKLWENFFGAFFKY